MARARTRLSVEDRRRQLLELGLSAFSGRSFDEVAVDRIADRAGISRGLLFHYFPTKQAFYVAVLQEAADQLTREALGRTDGSPEERLLRGLRAYFQFVGRRSNTYAALLRSGGADPKVNAIVEKARGAFLERLLGNVRARGGGRKTAELRAALRGWIGFVEALALDWIDHHDVGEDALVRLSIDALSAVLPGTAPQVTAAKAKVKTSSEPKSVSQPNPPARRRPPSHARPSGAGARRR